MEKIQPYVLFERVLVFMNMPLLIYETSKVYELSPRRKELLICCLGIWSLKIGSEYDNHLVVAFFDQTRYFHPHSHINNSLPVH